jgi:phospholipase C
VRVYDAIRTASNPGSSNWANTLLLVTFDEHGGTYDHVPPPEVPPPDPAAPPGEEEFTFNRSGVRIPTLAISAWVDAGTLVTQEFRSTSVIRTLRERWSLGGPLTARDAIAPDLSPILSREAPRPPEEWPQVTPRSFGVVAKLAADLADLDQPMERLERDVIGEARAHEARALGREPPTDVETMTHRQAHDHAHRIGSTMFPGIANGRRA